MNTKQAALNRESESTTQRVHGSAKQQMRACMTRNRRHGGEPMGGGGFASSRKQSGTRWDTTKLVHVAPVSSARERTMK